MIDEVTYDKILAIRQEVMYPDKDLEFVKVENDGQGLHLGFYEEGEPVSIVSLFLKDRELQFRKLATLTSMQGQGYGTKLMKWILDYARDMKFERVWANARVDALDFYRQLGFEETDNRFSKNGYDYVVIEKKSL